MLQPPLHRPYFHFTQWKQSDITSTFCSLNSGITLLCTLEFITLQNKMLAILLHLNIKIDKVQEKKIGILVHNSFVIKTSTVVATVDVRQIISCLVCWCCLENHLHRLFCSSGAVLGPRLFIICGSGRQGGRA